MLRTDILDRVPSMTGSWVTVSSGTLYNLLEHFSEAGMIRETKVEETEKLSPHWEGAAGARNKKGSSSGAGLLEIFRTEGEQEVLDTGWGAP
ncbi:MAG: hypothetical protein ACLU8D_07760 [Enterocloster sp.]